MTHSESVRYENNLNRLFSFAESVTSKAKTPVWLITEHRCPVCNKAVTNPMEFDFMQSSGECGTCDHVRGEHENN